MGFGERAVGIESLITLAPYTRRKGRSDWSAPIHTRPRSVSAFPLGRQPNLDSRHCSHPWDMTGLRAL